MKREMKKIVLAYSGGLDTSIILRWLINTYQCPVVAFVADLGQGEDLAAIRHKALMTGASEVFVEDLKEEFVKDFVFPMFRANAIYEGFYLMGTSIARPLIAKKQIEIANQIEADAVSHGATGKGNDQVRFELTYQALKPEIKIVAPWRIWDLNSREDLVKYAEQYGIAVPVSKDKPYSCDRNLLHTSFEGGILEDPWMEPREDMFLMTKAPEKAPDKPVYLEISFEEGNPVALDGKRYSPAKLLGSLNVIGGENGIGRVDMVENRFVGMKSRGVYETPGGTIIYIAHRALESLTLDREVMHIKDSWVTRYSEMIYYGFWFSPEREMLQKAIDESQKDVEGVVKVKLFKGTCSVVGRKSRRSLYRPDLATFEADQVYRQYDAEGFIRLNGLRLRVRSTLK